MNFQSGNAITAERSLAAQRGLTKLLLEINAHIFFADEFTHVTESNDRAEELAINVCAVLLTETGNIGLEPLIKYLVPALTWYRLSGVKQNRQLSIYLILGQDVGAVK